MNTRNYIELGLVAAVFVGLLIWKLITRRKVAKMDGAKGEITNVENGTIVGKIGNKK